MASLVWRTSSGGVLSSVHHASVSAPRSIRSSRAAFASAALVDPYTLLGRRRLFSNALVTTTGRSTSHRRPASPLVYRQGWTGQPSRQQRPQQLQQQTQLRSSISWPHVGDDVTSARFTTTTGGGLDDDDDDNDKKYNDDDDATSFRRHQLQTQRYLSVSWPCAANVNGLANGGETMTFGEQHHQTQQQQQRRWLSTSWPCAASATSDGGGVVGGGGGVSAAAVAPTANGVTAPPTTTTAPSSSSLAPYFPDANQYALPQPIPSLHTNLRVGQRIISFGDVHGDIDALIKFCVIGGIMDSKSTASNPIWIGGDTIVIQCGDILDRGDDEMQCLRLLSNLAFQAERAGGSLTVLYGNHEVMNAAGLFHYTQPRGNVELESVVGKTLDERLGDDKWRIQYAGNEPSRWAAFEPGGLLSRCTMSNLQVAVVVGRTCFVHAGLTAEHLREYGGVEGMNAKAREWILQAHHGNNNNDGIYRSVEDVINSANGRAQAASKTMPNCLGGGTGTGSESPVWMRDFSSPNDAPPRNTMAQSMIDEALQELGNDVQRMVMGHTPQYQINSALNGKAWRIDVGASRGVMGNKPEVLEIIHKGGRGGVEDVVSVLTLSGERIDGGNRGVFHGDYVTDMF